MGNDDRDDWAAGTPSGRTEPAESDPVKEYALRVWRYKMGEVVSLMIHLGDRLGLYEALAGAGPLTSAQVADRAGLDERLVREWLLGQASARLVDLHPDGRFELQPAGAAVLADEDGSIDFAGGAFMGGTTPSVVDALADSFQTGIGISYEQLGPVATAGMARMNAPRFRHALVSTVVPAVDGLGQALDRGMEVVEIGCGAGGALLELARAFPRSTFVGIDPSTTAITLAREQTGSDGLTNVTWTEGVATDIAERNDVGLVLAFDCLHDMPRPDRAVAAVAGAVADDGVFLVKEIRTSGSFERDSRNPLLPLLYGYSIMSCLQSALSEPDGLGLGTLGLHGERLSDMVMASGFGSITTHDLGDPHNLYYEIRR